MPTGLSRAARTLFVSAVYLALYVVAQEAAIMPFMLASEDYMNWLFPATVISMFVCMAIYAALGLLRERPISSELNFAPVSASTVIYSVLMALGLRGVVGVYTVLSENVPALVHSLEEAPDYSAALSSPLGALTALLAAGALAPVFEEILFRGLVQTELMRAFPAWAAILLSSLGFAAMHGLLFQSLFTFFCGLALGWVYYRTGSLLPGIALHITFNASVALQTVFFITSPAVTALLLTLSLALVFIAARNIKKNS